MSSAGDRLPVFDTFTLAELMRLDEKDFDQLDALEDEDEGSRLWWFLTRQIWAEQDQAGEG
jgi:hypothetical protein